MNAAVKTAEILGFKGSDIDFDAVIRKGFSASVVGHLKTALDMSDLVFAQYIGISIKTLQRKRASHARFTLQESDRMYRIARILAVATVVFGGEEDAREWLMQPQFILDQEVPFNLMQTEAGAQEVEDALGRIAEGVLV